MSEKLAERVGPRPATGATESSSEAAESKLAGLTPAERAEMEIAKLDEDMDAILGRQQNRAALVNPPGAALAPPQGRTITPSVSNPVDAKGVNHLAMNVFVPGLGSLAHGRYMTGLLQMALLVLAVPVLFRGHLWIALLQAVFAYVWSIASGIGFLRSSD